MHDLFLMCCVVLFAFVCFVCLWVIGCGVLLVRCARDLLCVICVFKRVCVLFVMYCAVLFAFCLCVFVGVCVCV